MFMRFASIILSILCMPSFMLASSAAAAAQAATSAAADQKTMAAEAAVAVPADVYKAIEAGDSDAVIAWLQKNPEAHKNARGPESRPLLSMLIKAKVQGKESLQAAIDAVLNYNPDVWLRDNETHSALYEAAYEREDGQIARNLVQRMYAQAKKTGMFERGVLGAIKKHTDIIVSMNDTGRTGYDEANKELKKIVGQEAAELEKIKEDIAKHLPDIPLAIVEQYLVAQEVLVEREITAPYDVLDPLSYEKPQALIAWIKQDPEKHKNARVAPFNEPIFKFVFSRCIDKKLLWPVIDFVLDCKPYMSLERHPAFFRDSPPEGIFYNFFLHRNLTELLIRKVIGILREQGHWWIRIREEMLQDAALRRNFSRINPHQVISTIAKEIKEAQAMTPLIGYLPRELFYIVQDYVSLVGDGSSKIARNDTLTRRMQQLQIEEIDVKQKQSTPSEPGCCTVQ